MHPGPYLVIPLIGPSTLRDGIGWPAITAPPTVNVANLYRGNESWYLGVVNAVDERANVDFRYYATGSPFEYETIRFLYVRKRLIEDEGLRRKSRPKKGRHRRPGGRVNMVAALAATLVLSLPAVWGASRSGIRRPAVSHRNVVRALWAVLQRRRDRCTVGGAAAIGRRCSRRRSPFCSSGGITCRRRMIASGRTTWRA